MKALNQKTKLLILKYFFIYLFFKVFVFSIYAEKEKLSFPIKKEESSTIPLLSMKQIDNIKDPKPPEFIYYFEWEKYAFSKKILKKGILFTYRNLMAKNVYIAGNFTNWKKIKMSRNTYGVFYYIQPIVYQSGERLNKYFYKFYIDGVWVNDPTNEHIFIDKDQEKEYSYFYFDDPELHYLDKTEIIDVATFNHIKLFLVEFRIHEKQLKRVLNKSTIQTVSVVGDFNFWDPDINVLKKDEKGIYRFKTYLTKGTHFYNFVVDGEWILDPLNENTKYLSNFKKLFNYLTLE
jgi:hypothetical protein